MEAESARINNEFPVYKIVISGGPCAGKSTSLKRIREEFTKKGFNVLSVLEVPTLVVEAGGMILMSKFNIHERIKFQSLLMKFQMYAEEYFTKLATMSKGPSIVLCDRGVVDPYAYVSHDEFQAILDEEGWNWVTLRDKRYDRVIFLNSAANGAEKFYTLDNNVARHQGLEMARELDQKTLRAWTGHPHLTVVPNVAEETFEQKIDRVIDAVSQTVSAGTVNLNRYEKYQIEKPVLPEDLKVDTCFIEETFLENKDERFEEDKIKRRGTGQSFVYQRKYRGKKDEEGGIAEEIRKPLTSLNYVILKEENADKDFVTSKRERMNFVWKDVSYKIDVFSNIMGQDKVYIMRYQPLQGREDLIPEFVKTIKNVKKEKEFYLREICRIKKE